MQRKAKDGSLGVGIISVAAVVLLVSIFFFARQTQTAGGYRVGVRFASASGLDAGAPVYLSGVQIGAVDSVQVLPDNTVEVVLAIFKNVDVPIASRITIHAPLTGSSDVAIIPPLGRLAPGAVPTPLPRSAIMPKRILPLEEQPVGNAPLSAAELLTQSQALMHRSTQVVNTFQERRRPMLAQLNAARANSGAAMATFRELPETLRAKLADLLRIATSETGRAKGLAAGNGRVLADLSKSLAATSASLESTKSDLQNIRTDPGVQANVSAAMRNVQLATQNMHAASIDVQSVGANPQTRADLLDASRRLHAAVERLHSLIAPTQSTSAPAH